MVCSLSDAVSQRAVLLAALLVGTLLVQPGLQAPARPWDAPCGTHKEETGKTPAPHIRHPAMKAVKRVRTQLRLANEHYKKELTNINTLYAEVKKVLKVENFNYSWLPKLQMPRYRAELRCLNKTSKMEDLLPTMHTASQIYLVTFESLNNFPVSIQDPQDVSNIKKRVLDEMQFFQKKVLCEVEFAILSSNLKLPSRVSEEIIPRSDRNLWDTEPDHTTSLMQTWGILASYKKFLQEWQKIFQEAMKKVPADCTPGSNKAEKPQRPGPRRKTMSDKTGGGKAAGEISNSNLAPKTGPKRKSPTPKHKKTQLKPM